MTLSAQQQKVMNDLLLEAVGNKDLARIKTYVPDPAETTRDIQILKPLELSPRKKSGGFNL